MMTSNDNYNKLHLNTFFYVNLKIMIRRKSFKKKLMSKKKKY